MGEILKEINVGENSASIDDKNIVRVNAKGTIDSALCLKVKKAVYELLRISCGDAKFLVDINHTKRPCKEFRDFLINELYNDERILKTALFGLHPVARTLASFLVGTYKKSSVRFFTTEQEAIKWLEE